LDDRRSDVAAEQANRLSAYLLASLCIAAVVLMRLEIHLFPYAHQFLVGTAFGLLLTSFAKSDDRLPFCRWSHWLAEFSYSLYLIHFPVLLPAVSVLFSAWRSESRLQTSPVSAAWFVGIVLRAIVASFLVALVTEAKTAYFRHRLYRILKVETAG